MTRTGAFEMNTPIIIPMEDELIHTAENGYRCDDLTCPCHDEPEPMDADYINLSARSVAEFEPYEQTGSEWYLSRPNQSDWLVE
jgi:hypothetical protein